MDSGKNGDSMKSNVFVNCGQLDGSQKDPGDLAGDENPLRVGVDSELDRGVRFGRIGFGLILNNCQDRGFHPPPDNPMPSSSSVCQRAGLFDLMARFNN